MKRPTLTRLGSISIVVLLLLSQLGFGSARRIPPPMTRLQNDVAWIPFIPEGEEFAAKIPGLATVLNEPANYIYRKDGERVLQHRDFSGYGNGLVFIIDSYKAKRPQKLMAALLDGQLSGATFEREITFNGIAGRQYRNNYLRVPLRVVCFTTDEHAYFLKLAALDAADPVIDKFLGGFRLRTRQDKETPDSFAPETFDLKQDQVFLPWEVTRKTVIAWKPIPAYTEKARVDGLIGTVVVEADFAANGYVTNIKATKEMKDGMTEKAIDCTRNIRFFPAEKDGKPVSVRMVLEYHFNLF